MKIEVTMTLKEAQRRDANKWECTLLDEERVVTHQIVRFYATTPEQAVRSIEFSEVDTVDIRIDNKK